MKYIVLLALLVGAGYFVKNRFFSDSPAVIAYEEFASALFRGNFPRANGYLDSDESRAELERRRSQQDFADRNNELGGIKKMEFQIKEERYSDGGTKVHLEIYQRVFCGRKQLMTTMSSAIIGFNHAADLVKNGESWKVKSFQFALGEPKPGAGSNYTGMD